MSDPNEIIRRLAAQAGGQQMLEQLRAALNTPEGRKAVQSVSSQHVAELEQAAQAAKAGDMQQAARLAQQFMQTGEGAALAAQLQKMFRQ